MPESDKNGSEPEAEILRARARDLKPNPNNDNLSTERGSYMLGRSIEKHGFRFAGTLDRNRTIVHGNHRHERAGEAGLEEVVIIKADPNKQYFLQFDDLDLSDPTNAATEVAHVANRVAAVSINLDEERIRLNASRSSSFDLSDWWSSSELGVEGLDVYDEELDGFAAGAQFSDRVSVILHMTIEELNEKKRELYALLDRLGISFNVRAT